MAKVKGPLLSNSARGNFGGVIQFRGKGGSTHAHRPPDPAKSNQNPASTKQAAVRAEYTRLRLLWRDLPEPQKQSYRDQAWSLTSPMTGWNLFLKSNWKQENNMTALLFSDGQPSDETGANDTFCLDYTGFMFYGPKANDTWGEGTKLITAEDLADVLNGLGLGSAATHDAADFATPGSVGQAISDLNLGTASTHDAEDFAPASQPYDIGAYQSGKPDASQVVCLLVSNRTFTLPQGLTGSHGTALTGATAQAVFDIQKNGSSIGSMTFAQSGNTATFALAQAASFVAGDTLAVIAPSSQDATLAGISFLLAGTR